MKPKLFSDLLCLVDYVIKHPDVLCLIAYAIKVCQDSWHNPSLGHLCCLIGYAITLYQGWHK